MNWLKPQPGIRVLLARVRFEPVFAFSRDDTPSGYSSNREHVDCLDPMITEKRLCGYACTGVDAKSSTFESESHFRPHWLLVTSVTSNRNQRFDDYLANRQVNTRESRPSGSMNRSRVVRDTVPVSLNCWFWSKARRCAHHARPQPTNERCVTLFLMQLARITRGNYGSKNPWFTRKAVD